jgi:hypothetical protein
MRLSSYTYICLLPKQLRNHMVHAFDKKYSTSKQFSSSRVTEGLSVLPQPVLRHAIKTS